VVERLQMAQSRCSSANHPPYQFRGCEKKGSRRFPHLDPGAFHLPPPAIGHTGHPFIGGVRVRPDKGALSEPCPASSEQSDEPHPIFPRSEDFCGL
jgi:hypothetical protein